MKLRSKSQKKPGGTLPPGFYLTPFHLAILASALLHAALFNTPLPRYARTWQLQENYSPSQFVGVLQLNKRTNLSTISLEKTQEQNSLTPQKEIPSNNYADTQKSEVPSLLPTIDYYARSELSEGPVALIEPDMNTLARFDITSTQAILFIDEEGRVSGVQPTEANLPEDMIDQLINTFSQMRFKPGRIGKASVKSWIKVEAYRLDMMTTEAPNANSSKNQETAENALILSQ